MWACEFRRRNPVPQMEPASLRALPLHVVVRDLPECLEVLRRADIGLPRAGAESLSEAAGQRTEELLREIGLVTAWRAPPAR